MKARKNSVLQRMRDGNQVLCFCYGEEGAPLFWLDPSQRKVGRAAAHRAIETGELVPGRDALFEGASQTWKLKEPCAAD